MNLTLKSVAVALALGLSTLAARADVVVSSKIDTEGSVLGNIILLALNANGIKTQDRVQLGATSVVRKAIIAGEIDIYPEYTGNAGFFFNKADDPLWKNAAKGFEAAKKLDFDANKIVWLEPSPANNTWAIAVRKDVAEANKLATMSDFGKWVAGGGDTKLAASAEFVNSAAALAGLPGSLRLQDEARATDRPVGRRYGGDHQGRGREDQRRQCGDGLRHRWRHRALRPGGARG